jgi:hypothetical protein
MGMLSLESTIDRTGAGHRSSLVHRPSFALGSVEELLKSVCKALVESGGYRMVPSLGIRVTPVGRSRK